MDAGALAVCEETAPNTHSFACMRCTVYVFILLGWGGILFTFFFYFGGLKDRLVELPLISVASLYVDQGFLPGSIEVSYCQHLIEKTVPIE